MALQPHSITLRHFQTTINSNMHAVDNHNNLQHAIPSIEGSWITHCWSNRVFSFILAISEVNTFIGFHYFVWPKFNMKHLTLLNFCHKLALELIKNDFWKKDLQERNGSGDVSSNRSHRRSRHTESTHALVHAPYNASFF